MSPDWHQVSVQEYLIHGHALTQLRQTQVTHVNYWWFTTYIYSSTISLPSVSSSQFATQRFAFKVIKSIIRVDTKCLASLLSVSLCPTKLRRHKRFFVVTLIDMYVVELKYLFKVLWQQWRLVDPSILQQDLVKLHKLCWLGWPQFQVNIWCTKMTRKRFKKRK